jgi:hypothetical protein
VFGVVHDAGKLHWTNLTAWARALGSEERAPAAPVDGTFTLDERRLPIFLNQARAYWPPGSFERKNNGLPGHSLGRPAFGQEADMAADLYFRCFSLETTGRSGGGTLARR